MRDDTTIYVDCLRDGKGHMIFFVPLHSDPQRRHLTNSLFRKQRTISQTRGLPRRPLRESRFKSVAENGAP
jgi:hypothetical protein